MLKVPQKERKTEKDIILLINIFHKCFTNKLESGSDHVFDRDDIIEKYKL